MALFHFTRQEPPLHFARDGRDGHNTRMTRLPGLPDLKLHLEMASTRQLKQTGRSRVVSIHLDVDLATSASERNNKHPFTAASPTDLNTDGHLHTTRTCASRNSLRSSAAVGASRNKSASTRKDSTSTFGRKSIARTTPPREDTVGLSAVPANSIVELPMMEGYSMRSMRCT